MPKKLWSMSTTVRNPYRVKDFLDVLYSMEGVEWNKENQRRFQILLIQKRLYVPEVKELNAEQINILNSPLIPMTYRQAEDIFNSKNYEDPPMRGRTSYKPLEKAGLSFIINNKITITDLGKRLISGEIEIDDFCFRSLIQWQYPNPLSQDFSQKDGYNIKPFVSTLLLIQKVNELSRKEGLKIKGISKDEFGIFALSLIDYKNIDSVARMLLEYRNKRDSIQGYKEQKEFRIQYSNEYLKDYINYSEGNIRDYTDNVIRYFRLTKYIYIRGGDYYVDLEPRRIVELKKLLKKDNGSAKVFSSKGEYIAYMSDSSIYNLPWENVSELQIIAQEIIKNIHSIQKALVIPQEKYHIENSIDSLNKQIRILRQTRTDLQAYLLKKEYSDGEKIMETIQNLSNLRNLPEKPSIALEKYVSIALNIINDAIQIKPNSLVGDDNNVIFTAPGNMADIEFDYQNFRGICEVTTLTGRDQWYAEGQPVMRHLRDYENNHSDKPSYCLFISPALHPDTANTFWFALKYEFEGKKQRIIPLSIYQIIDVLKLVLKFKSEGKRLQHNDLLSLYNGIVSVDAVSDSKEWITLISSHFYEWLRGLSK